MGCEKDCSWLDRLEKDNTELKKRIAELETVEWVYTTLDGFELYECPWCKNTKDIGHTPDCVRSRK